MPILQAAILAIAGLVIVFTILAALKNVRGPRKGRYRLSWFERK
ncbi:MAG TPA: hypothetical protein VFO76_08915 [Candidatus Kapabacteria bacterium]|nr:hypothetical protein [Candidatus Kapabacteria bacterium]